MKGIHENDKSEADKPGNDGRASRRETVSCPFKVSVSVRFLVMSLISSMLLAFAVGRAARLMLLEGPRRALLAERKQSTLRDRLEYVDEHIGSESALPLLVAKDGREIPHTRYTSKNFDTARSVASSSWLSRNRDVHATFNGGHAQVCYTYVNGTGTCSGQDSVAIKDAYEDEVDPQPAGEHLMLDIKNVDGAFLNSEQLLSLAMLDVVNEAELTLLSFHCHGLMPAGVSCVGVLLHNYISFHTWPAEGVITFDLCSAGSKSILPVLPLVERLFGVPRTPSSPGQVVEQPEYRWAHKLRGFRHHPTKSSNLLLGTDLGAYILSILGTELKEEIAAVETDFQRIDIYDTIYPKKGSVERYIKSLSDDGSYESRNPFLFRPDRSIMLDGAVQSSLFYEAAYHEALVHPALFAHSNPKRVAIIGGGEGATLRETLKHNTVEEVVMIEIDEMVMTVSRQHIPELSDCSDLVGSASWCGDDPRVKLYYEDALAWFMTRYSDGSKSDTLVDVIIMDAVDPESKGPFAKSLYGDDTFMRALYNSLSDDGVLVMQLGEAPKSFSPDETYSKFKNRAALMSFLEKVGFQSIHTYEEAHCGFDSPWTFALGFKSYSTRKRWYANEGQVDLAIRKRSMRTKSGTTPFKYFDGPTMVSYQLPPRSMEAVFCRRNPTPEECLYGYHFDPEYSNVPASSFEVKKSSVGENAGRGVFAKVDIPENAYLSLESNVHSVIFMPSTVALIEALEQEPIGDELESLTYYMAGYGFTSRKFGDREVAVDSGIMTFVNHGCNKTYNVGEESSVDELTANDDVFPDDLSGNSHAQTSTYNPVVDRHLRNEADQSIRDIKAGEEILDNYLAFIGAEEYWAGDVQDLRDLCSGAVGLVTEYENYYASVDADPKKQ